jgi:hypothetical protein
MSDTIIKYIDRSGDKGKSVFRGRTFTAAFYEAFAQNKSYCGFYEHVAQTKVAMTAKPTPDTDPEDFNDKDVKCILVFLDTTNDNRPVRVVIPAPKINVLNGIVAIKSNSKLGVPGTKPDGALGDDGNTMATQVETMLGYEAGDLVFSSGSFIKKSK